MEEEPQQTNPAGRLYMILSRAKDFLRTPSVNTSAGNLWAGVFSLPSTTVPVSGPVLTEVISRLLQLDQLISDTEASLKRIEGLPEMYFRPFEAIRKIPQQSLVALSGDISGTIRSITPVDMNVLEFCSHKLEEQHFEHIVDEGELQQILEDVSSLFNDVRQSGLDPKLKMFILDQLESIRRGIFEFRIRGPERLKETLAEIIGTFVVNHDVVLAARSQDENIVARLEKAFYRLAAAVSFAVDGPALLSAFRGALPGGG